MDDPGFIRVIIMKLAKIKAETSMNYAVEISRFKNSTIHLVSTEK